MLKNQLLEIWTVPPSWLRFLVITLLVLGLFFRLVNLDQKVYWFDETYTSLRTAGFTETELVENLSNSTSAIINLETLQKYQQLNPIKGVVDTIKSLALEDPQHPPFYYLLARFWAQAFGSSVTAMRSLPALISLLAFPAIYWLCWELFTSPLTGWVAVSLLAVSPLHVLYAQEAREYSLWTVTILALSAALLRAMRLKTKLSWLIYGLTLTSSIYTFLLSFFVVIGHGIYIIILERVKLTKTFKAYLLATLIGFIAFIPWIAVVLLNRVQAQSVTAWTGVIKKPLGEMLKIWGINFSRVFLDFNYNSQDAFIAQASLGLAIVLLLALFVYSVYFLCHHTPQRIWLFILTLMGTIMLPFLIPDLVLGGVRSITPRYFIPCYLGIQISVSYLLAHKITSINDKTGQQKVWQFILVAVMSLGVVSCVINSQAKTWWHQTLNRDTPAVAEIINKAERPLLISSNTAANILSLSYLLNSNVQFLYNPECYTSCNLLRSKNKNVDVANKLNLPKIPNGFSDIFLFETAPSQEWLSQLGKNQPYKIETKLKPSSEEFISWLWRVEKRQ
jgi:uncharacterized membrane protein